MSWMRWNPYCTWYGKLSTLLSILESSEHNGESLSYIMMLWNPSSSIRPWRPCFNWKLSILIESALKWEKQPTLWARGYFAPAPSSLWIFITSKQRQWTKLPTDEGVVLSQNVRSQGSWHSWRNCSTMGKHYGLEAVLQAKRVTPGEQPWNYCTSSLQTYSYTKLWNRSK